jgi:hypothetical protein
MGSNLLQAHLAQETYGKRTLSMLLGLTVLTFFAAIFGSTGLVFASLIGLFIAYLAFFKPVHLLAIYLFYLPFEVFILKWIDDSIYIYVRYFSELIIYLLVFVVVWRLIFGFQTWRSTRADLPFALFLFAILASSLLNFVSPTEFILGTRQIIRFILLYFVTVQLHPTSSQIKKIISILAGILGLQIAIGYAQYFFGERLDLFLLPAERRTFGSLELTGGTDYFWNPGERIFSTFGRYDQFGIYLAFNMLFLVPVLYEEKIKPQIREVLLPLLLLSLPVLALTYSRSAWFGFLLGFCYIAYFLYRDKKVIYAFGFFSALAALYILLTGLQVGQLIDVAGQNLVIRFFEAFSIERWRGEYFGLGRVFWIVQTLLVVWPASPIFGHGPAHFGGGGVVALQNTSVYDQLGLPYGIFGTQGMIDNSWLSLLGELGLLGFVAFIWLYFGFLRPAKIVFNKSKESFTRIFAAAMSAMLLAVTINAFLATYLEVRTLGPYLWVGLGFLMVLANRENINTNEYENNTSQ